MKPLPPEFEMIKIRARKGRFKGPAVSISTKRLRLNSFVIANLGLQPHVEIFYDRKKSRLALIPHATETEFSYEVKIYQERGFGQIHCTRLIEETGIYKKFCRGKTQAAFRAAWMPKNHAWVVQLDRLS